MFLGTLTSIMQFISVFLFAKENKEVQFQNVEKSVGKFFTFMSFCAGVGVLSDGRSIKTFFYGAGTSVALNPFGL